MHRCVGTCEHHRESSAVLEALPLLQQGPHDNLRALAREPTAFKEHSLVTVLTGKAGVHKSPDANVVSNFELLHITAAPCHNTCNLMSAD
jgi:hypothetical protein